MSQNAHARAVDPGAAACAIEEIDAATDSKSACTKQVVDDLGHRLPPHRHEPVEGAPTLAVSSVWRMARDRWVEVAP